jgi:cell division septation protein DedD
MSEIDFIDIFPATKNNEPSAKKDTFSNYNFDESDAAPGERIKISDYKHTSAFNHRGGNTYMQEPLAKEAEYAPAKSPKKALNLSDEKIVWAGAIFVFFGVFIFLIGYWLGKTTIKNVNLSSSEYITQMDEKIHAQQMEGEYVKQNTPGAIPQDSMTPVIPQVTAPPIGVNDNVKKETVTPPSIDEVKKPTVQKTEVKPADKPKQDTPAVKPQDTKKPEVTPVKPVTANVAGNFTIQVSAHTSLDKARVIENELRNMGYQAYIVESIVNGIRYYRVRIGKFTDKNSASDVLAKLKQTPIGKDCYIINMN